MATFEVGQQAYPTKDEIRDQILNDQLFAAEEQGIEINILPGSDHYIRADAFAGPVSIAVANGKLARAAVSPLTAQGDDLLRLAAVHGVTPRPAAKARGYVRVVTHAIGGLGGGFATVTIPAGHKCTSPDGFEYQTTSAATVTLGQSVEVQALLAGEDGNQPALTKLSWNSSSVGQLALVCAADSNGLDGGADEDGVETVRQRLLDRLAAPGVGGNANHCNELARNSSAAIAGSATYCAIRGPGSVDVTIYKNSGDRTLDAVTIAAANAALLAELPGNWSIVTTTVNPEEVDVIFDTSLPLPAQAGGAGGGWRDADPWPAEITKVTDYNTTTKAVTVNSTATPVAGNKIAIWDPNQEDEDGEPGRLYEYDITGPITGGVGAWIFTVQGEAGDGFVVDHTAVNTLEPYVSAGAYSLTLYAKAARAQFALLGPGEKTASTLLLPRSRRHPPPDVTGPMHINSRIISAVESEFKEIALSYAARYETGTTTPITGPSIPATTADAPHIVVLKFLAFIADT